MSSQFLRLNEDLPTRQITFGDPKFDFNTNDD